MILRSPHLSPALSADVGGLLRSRSPLPEPRSPSLTNPLRGPLRPLRPLRFSPSRPIQRTTPQAIQKTTPKDHLLFPHFPFFFRLISPIRGPPQHHLSAHQPFSDTSDSSCSNHATSQIPQQSRFQRKRYKSSLFLLIYFPNLVYCTQSARTLPPVSNQARQPWRVLKRAHRGTAPRSLDGLFSCPSPSGRRLMSPEPQIPTTHDRAEAPARGRPRTNCPSNGEKVSKKIDQQWTPLTRTTPRKSRESMQSMKSMKQENQANHTPPSNLDIGRTTPLLTNTNGVR